MPFQWEKIHDAFDRLVSIVGMQRSQAKVSGLGKSHRGFHSFRVANFTDEDDVGGLPQGVFESRLKRVCVKSNFALSHDGFYAGEQIRLGLRW